MRGSVSGVPGAPIFRGCRVAPCASRPHGPSPSAHCAPAARRAVPFSVTLRSRPFYLRFTRQSSVTCPKPHSSKGRQTRALSPALCCTVPAPGPWRCCLPPARRAALRTSSWGACSPCSERSPQPPCWLNSSSFSPRAKCHFCRDAFPGAPCRTVPKSNTTKLTVAWRHTCAPEGLGSHVRKGPVRTGWCPRSVPVSRPSLLSHASLLHPGLARDLSAPRLARWEWHAGSLGGGVGWDGRFGSFACCLGWATRFSYTTSLRGSQTHDP